MSRDLSPDGACWTLADLYAEIERFEEELRRAGLREASIQTYVDRARRFLRWLDGAYAPLGPR